MEESFGSIRNIWMEGGKSYCVSIPLEIIKKLGLTEDDRLYVELVDELIVMKKHDIHLTKSEITKAKKMTVENSDTKILQEEEKESTVTDVNPLDGHEF